MKKEYSCPNFALLCLTDADVISTSDMGEYEQGPSDEMDGTIQPDGWT